jgi:hypothetical protein
MKNKHNKKRNTAFLYEVIVREITNSILEKNTNKKDFLLKVCKAFFSKNSILKEELELYKVINETKNLEASVAEKILKEAKYQYEMLDKNKIFNQQTKLINILNKFSDGRVFSTFVPDYKNLASISQIFNNTVPIKEKVLLENTIIHKMSSSEEQVEKEKLQNLDALTYKLFVKKFNEQYGNELLSEQKELITKYVMSFSDNGIEFKLYLNDEIQRLKENLKTSLNLKQINEDKFLKDKTNLVLQKVENYRNTSIDASMIKEVLKIQSLVKEINFEDKQTNG